MADRLLMTPYQVAEYLQLNKLTVYKYIREGQLPAVRLGRRFRIRKADVDQFLEQHKLPPAPTVARSQRLQAAPVIHVVPRYPAGTSVEDVWKRSGAEEIHGAPQHDRSLRREEILAIGSVDRVVPSLH